MRTLANTALIGCKRRMRSVNLCQETIHVMVPQDYHARIWRLLARVMTDGSACIYPDAVRRTRGEMTGNSLRVIFVFMRAVSVPVHVRDIGLP